MAAPTLANLVTNAAPYTRSKVSERDQRLFRLAGKLRCAAVALHSDTVVSFATGSAQDWKNLLAVVEGQTVMGPIDRNQIAAGFAYSMNFIADVGGNTFAQRNALFTAVQELDPIRLERLELYVDFIAYDGIVNAS